MNKSETHFKFTVVGFDIDSQPRMNEPRETIL